MDVNRRKRKGIDRDKHTDLSGGTVLRTGGTALALLLAESLRLTPAKPCFDCH